MHRLLQRQLTRAYGKNYDLAALPAEVKLLVEQVAASYENYEHELKFIERILDINSRELNQKNETTTNVLKALSEAQKLSGIGSWEYDYKAGNMTWSDQMFYLIDKLPGEIRAGHDLMYQWLSPEFCESYDPDFKQTLKDQHFEQDYKVKLDEGSFRYFFEKREVHYNEAGEVSHIRGIIQDISEQKRFEMELQKARQRAESATQMKGAFLANMSHEIRTPMNAIIGMTYLVLKSKLNDWQRNYVRQIQGASQSLLNIINDILDFSKIEAGKLQLVNTPFNLDEVLSNVFLCQQQHASDKNVELVLAIRDPILLQQNIALIADAVRLEQVLTNLMSNAVKFTHQGHISLAVDVLAHGQDSLTLEFSVADTGIGIDKVHLEDLFQEFTQVDSSAARQYQGTGLGLSICKNLVELMGGKISVSSTPGQGTRFSFRVQFPFRDNGPLPFTPIFSNLKVLIVDEQKHTRCGLRDMLAGMGIGEVSVTSDAVNANIQIMQAAMSQQPFQHVFLRWEKAHDEAGQLLQNLYSNALTDTISVTAVSSRDTEAMREQVKQWGADFVSRPLLPGALINVLTGSQDVSYSDNSKTESLPDQDLTGMKVLLVEDNQINRMLASDIMFERSIVVDVAVHGQQALDILNSKREDYYDVVLMDLQMPVMDGYETIKRIRRMQKYQNLPVVVMSAHAMQEQHQLAFSTGADDYVDKPVEPALLFSVLAKFFQQKSGERKAAQSPQGQGEIEAVHQLFHRLTTDIGDAATDLTRDEIEIPGLDTAAGIHLSNDNPALYRRVLQHFLKSYADFDQQLLGLLEQQDFEQAGMLAHSLKGIVKSIGAEGLQDDFKRLENYCTERDKHAAETQLSVILQQLKPLITAIRDFQP